MALELMRVRLPVLLLLVMSGAAQASECRTRLEPLLNAEEPKDSRSVFELCEAEATAGDAEAMYYVSFFYFGFDGFGRDTEKGVALARAAAEKGYAQAQYWLGWQHEIGGHLPQDNAAALEWYRRSAASGYCMASDRLARAHKNGELGLTADPTQVQLLPCKRQE